MTVCVAALFHWKYSATGVEPEDWGIAAVTASDRMLTSSDSQFESIRQKVAYIGGRTVILVAGEMTVHSEAIGRVIRQFKDNKNSVPRDIAAAYGREIQNIKAEQAEALILAPMRMNSDTFLAQQHEFQQSFIDKITDQMQGFKGDDVDAIVASSNGESVELFTIDKHGLIYRQNDIGFATIGIGGWHASSRLMQAGYHSNVGYVPALAAVYSAKRSAETAPGVGRETNLHVVLRDRIFEVEKVLVKRMAEIYDAYEENRKQLAASSIEELRKFIAGEDSETTGQDGKNANADGSPPKDASQAAQRNEGGKEAES